MRAKYLPLLLLGLLPTGASPPAAGVPDRTLSEEETVAGGTATQVAATDVAETERCAELRETEGALAEQEVHLRDQLALPDAAAWEKEAWKQELAYAEDSLEDLDKALEVHRCPTPSAATARSATSTD